MKKTIIIVTLLIVCFVICGCREKEYSEADYLEALNSINLGFDIDNYVNDCNLPTNTPVNNFEIVWELEKVSLDNEELYVGDCASLGLKDGVFSLVNKIEYDGHYLTKLYGYVNLIASINDYKKTFRITLYEKEPNLDLAIDVIKSSDNETYVSLTGKIVWINYIEENRYNIIINKGDENILVIYCYCTGAITTGDTIKASGIKDVFNKLAYIRNSDYVDCTASLLEKGSYDYSDKASYTSKKLKDINYNDTKLHYSLIGFNGVIKSNNEGSYPYYIEVEGNNEFIINVSFLSFRENDIYKDSTNRALIEANMSVSVSITGFLYEMIDNRLVIIIVPERINK